MSEIKLINNHSHFHHHHHHIFTGDNQFLQSENSIESSHKIKPDKQQEPPKELNDKNIEDSPKVSENKKLTEQIRLSDNKGIQYNVKHQHKQTPIKKPQSKLQITISERNQSFNQQPPSPIKQQKKGEQKVDKIINNLNAGFQKLNENLSELKQGCDDLEMKELLIKNKDERKEFIIKEFIERKVQENLKRKRKKKLIQERNKQAKSETISVEELSRTAQARSKVQENLKKLLQGKEKKQKERRIEEQQRKMVVEMYEKIYQQQKVNKKFHLRKEEQDEKRRLEELERRKQVLEKRKQAFKSIDIAQLQQHRRKYEQAVQQLSQAKRIKRQQQLEFLQSINMKIPRYYKGQAHEYVKQEREEIKHKKSQPKNKYNKIKEYQKYVRENYLPKTHQPVRNSFDQPLSPRNTKSHKQVKRYRFVNGVAYGEILETKPIAKSQAEQRNMGNEYLDYLKSLPKKKYSQEPKQPSLTSEDLAILDKKLNSIAKVKIQRNPLYQKSGRKSVQIKISDNPTREQLEMVIKQLKSKDQQTKLKQKLIKHQRDNSSQMSTKHKQVNQQIIGNIERKLNLLAKL